MFQQLDTEKYTLHLSGVSEIPAVKKQNVVNTMDFHYAVDSTFYAALCFPHLK